MVDIQGVLKLCVRILKAFRGDEVSRFHIGMWMRNFSIEVVAGAVEIGG